MNKNINILNITNSKINLLDLNRTALENFLLSLGAKQFSAQQIMKWIYRNECFNFYHMSNLNKKLRTQLYEKSYIFSNSFTQEQKSHDGTIKWITSLGENNIETVYIPEKNRSTLCLSSQIGCVLTCKFCATGKQGFIRNLTVSEIIGQIIQAKQSLKKQNINKSITNIVFMGMGEPLLNLKNVLSALKIILDKHGFSLSRRRVTLSTSGIVPALKKIYNVLDVCLAFSLHAPNDIIRNKIMPINKKYNIHSCLNIISKYLKKSHANPSGVTIEYVMLNGINDTRRHAYELANLLKYIPSKINLIPWNNFLHASFTCSTPSQINIFANILRKKGFITIIRKNRGQDIDAACGQLTGKIINYKKFIE